LSISPSTPKIYGTIITANTLRNISQLKALTTGSSLKKWSRIPNNYSLMEKFKKFLIKEEDLGNL